MLLRRWLPTDLEPYAALNADPDVREHFPSTLTRRECESEIATFEVRFDEYGYGLWAVEVPGVAPCIRFIGLDLTTFGAPFTPAVEVGWRLARDHWGNRIRHRVRSGAAVRIRRSVSTKSCRSAPGNVRSRSVMQRLGMTHDPADDFEHPRVQEGHPLRRHVLYRLSRITSDGSLSSRNPR